MSAQLSDVAVNAARQFDVFFSLAILLEIADVRFRHRLSVVLSLQYVGPLHMEALLTFNGRQ